MEAEIGVWLRQKDRVVLGDGQNRSGVASRCEHGDMEVRPSLARVPDESEAALTIGKTYIHHGGEDVPLVEVLARRGEVLGVNTLKRRPQ